MLKAAFELRLLAELGLMPNLVCCPVCMRYDVAEPVLRIDDADVFCAECLPAHKLHDFPVSASALQAVRHVLYSEPEKVFAFRMKGRSAVQFAEYAEKYLLYRLGGTFPALNIYKEMTATG